MLNQVKKEILEAELSDNLVLLVMDDMEAEPNLENVYTIASKYFQGDELQKVLEDIVEACPSLGPVTSQLDRKNPPLNTISAAQFESLIFGMKHGFPKITAEKLCFDNVEGYSEPVTLIGGEYLTRLDVVNLHHAYGLVFDSKSWEDLNLIEFINYVANVSKESGSAIRSKIISLLDGADKSVFTTDIDIEELAATSPRSVN